MTPTGPTPAREPHQRTTSSGTTVSLVQDGGDTLVILEHPDAPEDMRRTEAGRVIGGGYQPPIFAAFNMRPETLRAIADLIEEVSHA